MNKAPRKPVIRTSVYFPPATYEKLITRSKEQHRSLASEVLDHVEKGLHEAEKREQLSQSVG